MVIPTPITKTQITTVQWGIPITNEVNRLTSQTASATDLAALQTLLQAITNPTWFNVPLVAGYNTTPLRYAIADKLIMVQGLITNTTGANATTNTVVGTMPLEARPLATSVIFNLPSSATVNFQDGKSMRVSVGTTGSITVQLGANIPWNNNTNVAMCVNYWTNNT